jgi:Golgi nucleoside diphosphatase
MVMMALGRYGLLLLSAAAAIIIVPVLRSVWFRLRLFLALAGVSAVLNASAAKPSQTLISYQYIITIDGGSSGSRLHVHRCVISPDAAAPAYSWGLLSMSRVFGAGSSSVPKVESMYTHKLRPGLSSYEAAPSNASHSIRNLLELALDQVPRTHWRKTPVFLKA